MYMGENEQQLPLMNTPAGRAAADINGELYNGHQAPKAAEIDYVKNYSISTQLGSYIKSGALWKCSSDTACKTNITADSRFTSYHYRFCLGWSERPAGRRTAGSISSS